METITRPKLIMCAGNNKNIAEIAISNNWLYGARLPSTVYFDLYFADQNWKKPNRLKYIEALKKHKPTMATVLDLETESQFSEVFDWCYEIADDVPSVKEIVVIPKYPNVINKISHHIGNTAIILGYSVPTKYGKTILPLEEFGNRPTHLLGGSPHKQMALATKMNIYSLDSNMSWLMANRFCKYWKDKKWVQLKAYEKDAIYVAFNLSMKNIMEYWQCTYK